MDIKAKTRIFIAAKEILRLFVDDVETLHIGSIDIGGGACLDLSSCRGMVVVDDGVIVRRGSTIIDNGKKLTATLIHDVSFSDDEKALP